MFRVLTYSFEGAQREAKSISAFESGHGWWRSIARRIEWLDTAEKAGLGTAAEARVVLRAVTAP